MNLPPCHRFGRPPPLGHGLCLLALLPVLSLAGCSNLGVQPWERDLLAKPAMQLNTRRWKPVYDDHIYFSKEAATGGRGTGGGGCGCN
jgi:hypothetical protein